MREKMSLAEQVRNSRELEGMNVIFSFTDAVTVALQLMSYNARKAVEAADSGDDEALDRHSARVDTLGNLIKILKDESLATHVLNDAEDSPNV